MCLINDDILQKCLQCKTQKNNESINGNIWKRCPKDIFFDHITLETSTF